VSFIVVVFTRYKRTYFALYCIFINDSCEFVWATETGQHLICGARVVHTRRSYTLHDFCSLDALPTYHYYDYTTRVAEQHESRNHKQSRARYYTVRNEIWSVILSVRDTCNTLSRRHTLTQVLQEELVVVTHREKEKKKRKKKQ